MKKIISILIILAMALTMFTSAVSVFAQGEPTISITLNRTTARVGDIIEATIRVENMVAVDIVTPVHFNPDVVIVVDQNGDRVLSGLKTVQEIRHGDGSAGVIPGQAVSEYFDDYGNPLFWNGTVFANDHHYAMLDNERGLYMLRFTNNARAITNEETLVTIRFVAVGAGDPDIRFATSADTVFDDAAEWGAMVFIAPTEPGGAFDLVFPTVNVQSIIVEPSETPTTPPSPQNPWIPDPDASNAITTVIPPADAQVGDTLTFEVPSNLLQNMAIRAIDENNGVMSIRIDADENITTFIIKVLAADVIAMRRTFVASFEFETPIGTIGFYTDEIFENLMPDSVWVIATLTETSATVTVDGTPLFEFRDFDDLLETHWAYWYIITLVDAGLLNGVSETHFEPESNVTREQFAAMLVRALGVFDATAECDFTDLSAQHWAYRYVASAVNAGLILGFDDGTFGIGRNITRQEMAVMVSRAISDGQAVAGQREFTDWNEIADWAQDAVAFMQMAGIISGMPDGSFAPMDNATRAQAARIIYSTIVFMLHG